MEGRFWGHQRLLGPHDDPGLVLEVLSVRGPIAAAPGRLLVRVGLNEELRKDLDPLVAQARGAEVVVSPDGPELLADRFPGADQQAFLRAAVEKLPTDPETILTSDTILELLADGYLESPALDPEALRSVARQLPLRDVNLDDVLELRAVSDDELRAVVPTWKGRPTPND
jgi:hypothetical protein